GEAGRDFMRIELDRLNELAGGFERVYDVGELKLDEDIRLTEPAQVRGTIKRHRNEVELRGELQGRFEAPCSRCLKPVTGALQVPFDERFVPAVSWREEDQHELSQDDMNLAVFDGEAIELDDLVREEILLSIPGQILCREDCRGLCPVCGIDKNSSSCQCE